MHNIIYYIILYYIYIYILERRDPGPSGFFKYAPGPGSQKTDSSGPRPQNPTSLPKSWWGGEKRRLENDQKAGKFYIFGSTIARRRNYGARTRRSILIFSVESFQTAGRFGPKTAKKPKIGKSMIPARGPQTGVLLILTWNFNLILHVNLI